MSTVVGDARASIREQNPEAQVTDLRVAGAARVFVDDCSSSRIADRPQSSAWLEGSREDDTLVIEALDRVAGTEQAAIELIRHLGRRGVRLRSLTEPILDVDPSTPTGEAIGGGADHGRPGPAPRGNDVGELPSRPRTRTIAGASRRAAVGRDPERTAAALQMHEQGHSIVRFATVLGVGKSSAQRAFECADDQRAEGTC